MANEKRLIDAEQAKRATYEEIFWTESEQAVVRNFLAKLPKVDAVEVVHASWIHASNKPGVWIGMKCSLCGARIRYTEFINGNHNYCHKCGARMDGERNDDGKNNQRNDL